MMINRTLEYVHHNLLMIFSLLIVNAYILTSLYGTHTLLLKAKFMTFSMFVAGFPTDLLDMFKQQN